MAAMMRSLSSCLNCKGGIDLKQASRRLARLGIPSKMRQSGRQTTESYPIGRVLTKRPLKKRDRLVEAAKRDQGMTDAGKCILKHRVQRAHANAAFKAPDCFFVLACKSVDPSSMVPHDVRIRIGRDRTINELDGGLVVADKVAGNQPGGAQRSLVILVEAQCQASQPNCFAAIEFKSLGTRC